MVYGVEGVGKSTFGAKSEKPIFISAEGGTDQLTDSDGAPVEELSGISSWDVLRKSVTQLVKEDHNYKTLVIDSADWIEHLAHAKIIQGTGKSITTCHGGYGAGYRISQGFHKELIDDLNVLREQREMNIVVTAHAQVKPVKDPALMEDYDGYEPKCHDMVSSLWREWTDGLFFVRFRTIIKANDDSIKARAIGDGSRVLYTVKQAAFQAKNRYGMPPEMPFTETFWGEFMKYARRGVSREALLAECEALLEKVTDETLKEKAKTALLNAKTTHEITTYLNKLKQITGEK
jgi:hypothetical protein